MKPKNGIAILGLGAIGSQLFESLRDVEGPRVAAVLVLEEQVQAAQARLPGNVLVTSSIDEILSLSVNLVVECAGHGPLNEYGPLVLGSRTDLLVSSVGALADAELESRLRDAVRASPGAQLLLPSGAVGGLDVLQAAAQAGLDAVEYTGTKPTKGWRGTRAEALIDLDAAKSVTTFYHGSAREAALEFPKNANVAAAIALAGIGFDNTVVRLAADPHATVNQHRVKAWGAFGSIEIVVNSRALSDNPKSSILAPMSLVKAIRDRERWSVFS
jgi:aspartate dehydrogenase